MIKKEVLEDVKSVIFNTQKNPNLETGFFDLDCLLANTKKSSIITIAGRESVGKTAFATSIMLNLLEKDKNCLYCSFAQSEIGFIKRLIIQLGEICDYRLYNSDFLNDNDKEKINKAIKKLSEYKLTVYDEYSTISTIKEKIIQVKPEFIFIDYLEIFTSTNNSISETMQELKQIAIENDCIIFVISKLLNTTKQPKLSDIKNLSVKNLSDIILFIYREFDYLQKGVSNISKSEIIVAKNKMGENGIINLDFDKSIIKFLNPSNCKF